MKQIALSVLLLPIGTSSYAAFDIDYTGDKSKVVAQPITTTPTVTKNLLLDNSVQFVVMHGKCEDDKVFGSGNAVELPSAMRMILPAGWRVFADEGTSLDTVLLTWRDGDLWTKLISQTVEKYKFKAEISCADKTLTFHPAPNRGIYSERDSIELGELQSPQPSTQTNISSNSLPEHSDTNKVVSQTNSTVALSSLDPVSGETINAYAERYASAIGYQRVAFKVSNISKIINGEIDPAKLRKSKEHFDFQTALNKQKLFMADGVDGVSGAKVLVVTDTVSNVDVGYMVFKVSRGMLSDNALELARVLGKSIGDTNVWPMDDDFKIPFSYDIVGVTGIDLFMELFKSHPVQAQFLAGQKVIYVVSRDTANRN